LPSVTVSADEVDFTHVCLWTTHKLLIKPGNNLWNGRSAGYDPGTNQYRFLSDLDPRSRSLEVGQNRSILQITEFIITRVTGIRELMRGMATLPQGNQELLVVRDKVGRPPGELGVHKSMKCDIFPSVI